MGIEEVLIANPKAGLAVFSVIVTFISTLAHKYLTDQEHLHNQKKRQKELQKEIRGVKDPKKMNEINAELLQITGAMLKHSLKPILFTFIPFLLLFFWLRGIYEPILSGWLWWYIGFSVISSMILRKLFKVA